MGELIHIQCGKCGYSRVLQLGQGMLDHRIDTVAEAFEGEAKNLVLNAAESGRPWNFRRQAGLCRSCREYYAFPLFHSEAVPGGCIVGNCPEGHGAADIRLAEEEPEHLPCPLCGRDAGVSRDGMWD